MRPSLIDWGAPNQFTTDLENTLRQQPSTAFLNKVTVSTNGYLMLPDAQASTQA
jgi:hypothetical protein